MKCDELKAEPMIINDDYTALCYAKESVDAAIDELKREHHKERHEYIDMVAKQRAEFFKRERRHKYKRCLAMALLWLERAENSTDLENELVSRRRCSKWMELAEKFKEAK